MTDDPLDRAIATLYEAPLDLQRWGQFIDDAGALVGGAFGGQFQIWDAVRNHMVFSTMPSWLPRQPEEVYNEQFAATDPRREIANRAARGEWIYDHDHLDERYVSRSPLYQDLLLGLNIRYCAGVRLHDAGGLIIGTGLFRAPDQRPFDAEDRARLQRLSRHMVHAGTLTVRLQQLRERMSLGVAALDVLTDGVVVTDGDGRIFSGNRASESLLAATRHARVVGGVLRARDADDARRLGAALQECVRSGVATTLHLGSPSLDRLVCRVVPLPTGLAGDRGSMALVVLTDPQGSPELPARLIAALFGLSQSESALAARLREGATLEDVAAASGNSVQTMRVHLRSIFAKTGTNRQPELVRLLRRVVPVRPPE